MEFTFDNLSGETRINSFSSDIVNSISEKISYTIDDDFALKIYHKGQEIQKKREKERAEKELKDCQLVNKRLRGMITKVTFSGDWTIVKWSDGTITKSVRREDDAYDKEKGFLVCVAKKLFDNKGSVFNEVMKKWCDD